MPTFPTARAARHAPGAIPASASRGNDSLEVRMARSWGGPRGFPRTRSQRLRAAAWHSARRQPVQSTFEQGGSRPTLRETRKPGNVPTLAHTQVVPNPSAAAREAERSEAFRCQAAEAAGVSIANRAVNGALRLNLGTWRAGCASLSIEALTVQCLPAASPGGIFGAEDIVCTRCKSLKLYLFQPSFWW